MPEEGRGNTDQRAVREITFASFDSLECCFIDNNFVEARFNETTTKVFKLLSGLNKQVSTGGWELDRNSLAGISSPDI